MKVEFYWKSLAMNFVNFGVKVHCQDELNSLNELGLVPYKHIDASTCSAFVLELFTRQHTSRKKKFSVLNSTNVFPPHCVLLVSCCVEENVFVGKWKSFS